MNQIELAIKNSDRILLDKIYQELSHFDELTFELEQFNASDIDVLNRFIKSRKGHKLTIIVTNDIRVGDLQNINVREKSVKQLTITIPGVTFQWLSN
jgi:hypothetical protein